MRLDSPIFSRSGDLLSLVARFPLLQRLSITDPSFRRDFSFDHDISINLPPPKIHDLVLYEISNNSTRLPEWFSFHGHLVDSLSVRLGSSAPQDLNRYLEVLGPSLLFFTMELLYGQEGTHLRLPAHRSLLTRLSIQIDFSQHWICPSIPTCESCVSRAFFSGHAICCHLRFRRCLRE